jgi:hypothetical protein
MPAIFPAAVEEHLTIGSLLPVEDQTRPAGNGIAAEGNAAM